MTHPDPDDAEIRAYVLSSDLPAYSVIAAAIKATFGPDRAWPEALIRTVRAASPRRGRRDRYQDDGALMAFIGEHAELITLDELLARAQAVFGADRTPSRSHLHRLVAESRLEARLEATAICGRDVG